MPLIFQLLLFYFVTSNPEVKLTVGVVYFTNIDNKLKQALKENLQSTYNCSVAEIKGIKTLPSQAWYSHRSRYRAIKIIEHLRSIKEYDKVIGITEKDISATSNGRYDWGVLGLGYTPGKSCVVSTFRMKTSDRHQLQERFIKVSLHEVGHTLGLPHCQYDVSCFMNSADGSIKTVDRQTKLLCKKCKKLI